MAPLPKKSYLIAPNLKTVSFWWVNHKQTFKVEFEEGYIWSPQENKNGCRNESYINLTKTAVGDTVFSYASGKIQAVGRVIEHCQEKKRPELFGTTGHQWNQKGWLVPIKWTALSMPFSPWLNMAGYQQSFVFDTRDVTCINTLCGQICQFLIQKKIILHTLMSIM
jgi:hypothetical protein